MPEAPGSKKQDRFFRLLIPADLSELSKARRLMEEVGRAAPLPDDRIFDLQVAVSEAAANAIEHAASEVEIAAWLLPDRVIVEVTNDGAFQPGLYKDDEHRRRGLGLPLMVSLADQVHVSRMSESQTRVSLTFFLGPRSQRDREGLSASPDAAVCQLEAETMKLELMTTRAEALDEERALTHEEMRQRVEELEKVMDIVPVAIWVAHDPECLDITGNQTANEFYEALPDENVSAGPAPGEQDTTRRFFQDGRELKPEELPMQEAAAQGADIRNSELQVLRPSGALMTMLGNASPLRDAQGQVRGCVGAFVDITERKRAEEALKDSEERTRRKLGSLLSPEGDVGDLELADIIDPSALQSFLEDFHQLARIPLAIIDLKGKVLVGAGWSDICTKFHRVHPETCRNCVESDTLLTTRVPEGEFRLYKCKNHMWDVATPIIVGGKHLGNVFSGQFFFEDEPIDRELFRLQARRYGFDEETYLGALDSVPRLSRDALDAGMGFFTKLAAMVSNESYGNIGLARAIAERDALLESLRVSEERFRLMFERHNAVMLLIDPATGALVDGNVAAAQFYGYPREELRTLSIHDLNQLPAEKVAAEYRKAATEGRTHFEFPHRGADGGTRWVDVHSAPIEMQGSQLLFSIIHDVTERRQAEEALKESRERLDLLAGIVENASQPVGIGFADGRLGVFNRAYSELLGYSQGEFQSLDWSVDLTPAEWREFEAKKLGELQETGHPVTYEKQYIRKNGSRIPVELLVHMARDADGAPLYYYSFITDLTERKQAEAERERLLAQERELAHELASTNDELQSQNEEIAAQAEELEAQTEELAAQIEELRVAHEELAVLYGRELEDARLKDALTQVDQSLISSLEHTEILDRALKDGAHALGAEGAVLEVREGDGWVVRSVFDLPPDLVDLHLSREEASVATAMEETGGVLALEDARLDRRVSASTLSRYGTTAALALPIRYRDRILGSLQFLFVSGPRRFSAAEIDFAGKLAVSAALALENARLFELQRNIASQLQQTILEMPAGIPHLRFSHLYRAATEEALVGGDFYDAFELEDGSIALLVGDVSGHGINAARVATMVKASLVAFAHSNTDPDDVLALVNQLLLRKSVPGFTSLLFAVLHPDTGMLTYCSAGHPNLLLGRATGVGFSQGANHTPLGIFPDWSCSSESVRLEPGDTLLFYTDGLTEARREGELFGEDRLMEAFRGKLDLPLEELPQALLGEVLAFTGGKLQDDVAILAVQPLFERSGEDG